jgi:hypothetical protein
MGHPTPFDYNADAQLKTFEAQTPVPIAYGGEAAELLRSAMST